MPVSLSSPELLAWLRLSTEPDLGYAQACMLLREYGLPDAIYQASSGQLAKWLPVPLASRMAGAPTDAQQALLETTLAWLNHPHHHLLTLADPTYPRPLMDLHDPPLVLYVNGSLDALKLPGLAMVGARSATPGGIDTAKAFAGYLAERGWCIVSGLAEGIDTAAHTGALETRAGMTIAVMATGLDLVFPARNRALAHRIAERGTLVSEFPLGTRALPFHFPRRNRLVAALARGVLVVEAALKSGSLITARLGAELGREVFAIPGSIHSPVARGCHALIRQGAKLVESGQDIHDELQQPGLSPAPVYPLQNHRPDIASVRPPKQAHPRSIDTGTADAQPARALTTAALAEAHPTDETPPADLPEEHPVLTALGFDPVDFDTLAERTGLEPAELHAALLTLELGNQVVRHDDGRFARRSGL